MQADISTPVHPLPVSSLLAHLLFLAVNGDLAHATALPDTFGTPSFVTLSLACDVPEALIEDLRTQHGVELHSGAKVFDLFRYVWSGYPLYTAHVCEGCMLASLYKGYNYWNMTGPARVLMHGSYMCAALQGVAH